MTAQTVWSYLAEGESVDSIQKKKSVITVYACIITVFTELCKPSDFHLYMGCVFL